MRADLVWWRHSSDDGEDDWNDSYKHWGVLICGRDTGKLLALLRAFPPNEPTKKKFVSEMIAWSGRAGEYPNGDPELHHVAGTLFAEGTVPA